MDASTIHLYRSILTEVFINYTKPGHYFWYDMNALKSVHIGEAGNERSLKRLFIAYIRANTSLHDPISGEVYRVKKYMIG